MIGLKTVVTSSVTQSGSEKPWQFSVKIQLTSAVTHQIMIQTFKVFNRHGVAGAVLETPLSSIHSLNKSSFVKLDGVGPVDNRPFTD